MVKRNEILENDMMDNSPENKIGGELPFDVLDDVVVFMQNDPDFYRTETYPTLVNVQKAINNGGKFNKKQMFPMIDKAVESYIKKFKVYVKNPKGNVVKVNFGQKGVKIKKGNPARRRSFRARHNCDNPGPRHKARYWSCRKW